VTGSKSCGNPDRHEDQCSAFHSSANGASQNWQERAPVPALQGSRCGGTKGETASLAARDTDGYGVLSYAARMKD
jgi:hypothetical protein